LVASSDVLQPACVASAERRGDDTALVKYDRDRAIGAWLLMACGFVEAAIVVVVLVT
jgi:hypothetical protein